MTGQRRFWLALHEWLAGPLAGLLWRKRTNKNWMRGRKWVSFVSRWVNRLYVFHETPAFLRLSFSFLLTHLATLRAGFFDGGSSFSF
jgi:hypothetical protein